MNLSHKRQLEAELKSAGATKSELKDLTLLATRLGSLNNANESDRTVINNRRYKEKRRTYAIGIALAYGVAIVVFLVIGAQSVLPGSFLYPVQKTTDAVAVYIDPSYRATVMMRTANQVRELVSLHASSRKVSQTLTEYQKQAASYKTTSDNYAALEYCKHRLEQAADKASPVEKQQIENTLQYLKDV